MDQSHELNEQVRQLSAELAEMRARLAQIESANGHARPVPRSDRRGFLKLGAGAVMGALGWAAVKVVPAAAATGDYMTLGTANTADAETRLSAVTNDIYPVFSARSLNFSSSARDAVGTFTAPLQGLGDATGPIEGVDGWAQGALGFGVYGLSDLGVGVAGESNQGVGVAAVGTGRFLQQFFPTSGTGQAPTYVPFAGQFEQVRDSDGVMWVNNPAGAWRRINSPRSDSDDGAGTAYKPFRIVDTRNSTGGFPGPHGTGNHTFQIAGQGSGTQHIPADAVAVFGNLTVTGFTGGGYLTITPAGVAHSGSDPSSVNFGSGMQPAIANSFFIGLGTGVTNGGKVTVYVNIYNGSNINYILDITGYVQ